MRGEAGADGIVGLGGAVLPGAISEGLVLAGLEVLAGDGMDSSLLRRLEVTEAAPGSRHMVGGCGRMMGDSHRCRERKAVLANLLKSTVGLQGRGLTWTWICMSRVGVVWMVEMLSRWVVAVQGRCSKKGHLAAACKVEVYCVICDSHDHMNHKCPLLKAPRPVAHAAGYAVMGLGFYHIPHPPLPRTKKDSKMAEVTVVGGVLTEEQLLMQLRRVVLVKWN